MIKVSVKYSYILGQHGEGCPVIPTDIHWDLELPLYYPIPCCYGAKRPYCPFHPTVPCGRTGIVAKCPICYTLSLPSHCTMRRNGQTGIVPKCPTCYTLSPLSIPSHCTMGGNGRTGIHTKVSHLLYPVTIPDHLKQHSLGFQMYHCTSVGNPGHV